MGQITKDHQFQPYQDLHYKAAVFTKQLEEMERISMEMQAQINKELESSSGKIVEETLNALKMNHLDEQLLIDSKILLFEISQPISFPHQ